MGNPASPILANLVVNHELKKIEGNLPFAVPFLKVYVDDIIPALPKDGIEVVLKTFNMINEKIQLTIEIENNGTLLFVDVTVIRNKDGTISTNYQKIGTVQGLLFRVLPLSIKKKNKCFKNTNIKLVSCNLTKINSINTKLKDKVNKFDQSNIVYKIQCECEKCYIGQTKQKIKKRLDQHKNDCKPSNANKTNTTALAAHHLTTGHNFNFDAATILDLEENWLKDTSLD
ncbi:hypothetical protein M0804_013553 [Polistes exclamans]|nr:hypothetical protein M0804_013553 [Polistes exclamans]